MPKQMTNGKMKMTRTGVVMYGDTRDQKYRNHSQPSRVIRVIGDSRCRTGLVPLPWPLLSKMSVSESDMLLLEEDLGKNDVNAALRFVNKEGGVNNFIKVAEERREKENEARTRS